MCLKANNRDENFIDYFDLNRFGYGIDKNLQKEEWLEEGISKVSTCKKIEKFDEQS